MGIKSNAVKEKKMTEMVRTRWTFFRVKLVFECEFEISWSLGPWEPGTLGPLDLGTLGLDLGTFGPLPSSLVSCDIGE